MKAVMFLGGIGLTLYTVARLVLTVESYWKEKKTKEPMARLL